jgi:RHH-type proline utilization regulon transcriptional repressor/proline dehydrogenase/delta 1-pyrroline-5-carboxylate dehydrogenase
VVRDPIAALEAAPRAHSGIPKPEAIYGPARANSKGIDVSVTTERERLEAAVAGLGALSASAIVSGEDWPGGASEPVTAPANRSMVVGQVSPAETAAIEAAFASAHAAQPAWDRLGGVGRGQVLRAMADTLEANADRLIAICAREAGKTLADGIAEVREAADFCRYYAHLAETQFAGPEVLTGPVGETNTLSLHGRGVFVCISPWNFPLAIFTGQIAAALAAGNAVLAKPAEQTALIAAEAVRLYHAAGLDPDLLHLLPGLGETVGAALTRHPGCAGVAFTGGSDTARRINQGLAAREGPIIPFIAETGGLNGLFVDTTALREQVIDDVILSAFGSAGQRCSALRVLFLPIDTADSFIEGLKGAMDCLTVGDPALATTDVGPVIDADALDALTKHAVRLRAEATSIHQLKAPEGGTFFGPLLAEIPDAGWLEREVFGPILHVVRYDPQNLAAAAGPFAAKGYGLTLGVHSRLDSFAAEVEAAVPAGNTYVNRSIIGAVVGVQPFGGEGLSGTGPKAGGPHALSRYAVERAVSVNITAQGGDPSLLNLGLD